MPSLPTELTQELIKSLSNDDKEDCKRLIIHLTHFDPANYLPNEIFLSIFAYLSPKDLLSASTISRSWRERAQDEELWRNCFEREGWLLDTARMEEIERLAEKQGRRIAEALVTSRSATPMMERRGSRKRKTEEAFSEGEGGVSVLDGTADENMEDGGEDEDGSDGMEGILTPAETPEALDVPAARPNMLSKYTPTTRRYSHPEGSSGDSSFPPVPGQFKLKPTVFQSSQEKLSWSYLYKQRRRLEANWEQGRYKMFQLPHPDHPEEGHDECVYTIQHTSRHLVSGSRDKTIRIWDLEMERLKGQPLRGHEASVLCLQFDERPEHDIIVSGGSDAYVIIWKFSTGEILQKMTNAHDESVLNLRFDDRYIVTCSKDKSIKIWSRTALSRDSPLIPRYVLENFTNDPKAQPSDLIPPYTLLTGLGGHHAAVNAVMIHDSTIVSASGDRTIKAWDLHTGQPRKNYTGHSKGIACVQFDGRRIVSGSSDNTVRIFDAEQQAEIACLQGHSNLVRTVQARFGDLGIVSDAELQEEAKKADRAFLKAVADGMTPASASKGSHRNAWSSRPEDMLSIGTKVPPGGGGSRWAKIVSGSYDETVILWKRDGQGKWVPRLRLHQDMLLRGQRRTRVQASALPLPANLDRINAQAAQGQQAQLVQAHGHLSQANQIMQHPQVDLNGRAAIHLPNSQLAAMAAAQQGLGAQLGVGVGQAGPANWHGQHHQGGGGLQAATANSHHQQNHAQAQQQQHAHNVQTTTTTTHTLHAGPAHAGHQHAAGLNANTLLHQPATTRDSNRVFKLQVDARRIICCSQNREIVGWDFANGERELERVGSWSLETA